MAPRLTGVLRQWIRSESGYPANWMPDLIRRLPQQVINVIPAGSGVAVMKEGYGRIVSPVNGHGYIRYYRGSYGFGGFPSGGGGPLVPRFSAAARSSGPLRRGLIIETPAAEIQTVFGSTRWKIVDTGGGLRRWQIDCYYGEDEPLGPGRLAARPRGTPFEYAYSTARVSR